MNKTKEFNTHIQEKLRSPISSPVERETGSRAVEKLAFDGKNKFRALEYCVTV